MHLIKVSVKLTELTKKQADCLGEPVEGPYESCLLEPCSAAAWTSATFGVVNFIAA